MFRTLCRKDRSSGGLSRRSLLACERGNTYDDRIDLRLPLATLRLCLRPRKRRLTTGMSQNVKCSRARPLYSVRGFGSTLRRCWPTASSTREKDHFRWVSFDASPQRPGIDMFASAERSLTRAAVTNAYPGRTWPMDISFRRLPLTLLGQGRASLADKVSAHCHQAMLDYGSSLENMRAANADVRGVLSDSGVELGICDYADLLDEIWHVGGKADAQPRLRRVGHLFPSALVIPGPQHIIDTVFKTAIETVTWWPDWVTAAKVVCQWLRQHAYREVLANSLSAHSATLDEVHGPQAVEAMLRSLSLSCDRFAEWRWKTLATVTTDLLRMEKAVRVAFSLLEDFATRDLARLRAVADAIRSEVFWTRTRALAAAVRPLSEFSAWLRGCECHESQRKAWKKVTCPWVGCRAGRLAKRLTDTESELQRARNDVVPSGVDSAEWVNLHTAILSSLQLKFSWVNEHPYTVLQLSDNESARKFLAEHDELEEAGHSIHRVSRFLAGRESWSLRREMETFARTGHCTLRLWSEIQAYKMCPVDETAIEAVHRDVSYLSSRAPAATVSHRAASLRLCQNLGAYDGGDASYKERVRLGYSATSAVCRPSSRRLIAKRSATFQSTAKFVYRADAAKYVDWGIAFEKHAVPGSCSRVTNKGGAVTRLRVELLRSILENGHFYSVPGTHDVEDVQFIMFQVLDLNVRRKKLLPHSVTARVMRGMVWPVRIQRMAAWKSGRLKYPAKQYDMFADGNSEIVEVVDLVAWPLLRESLLHWTCDQSDVTGCSSCSRPVPCAPANSGSCQRLCCWGSFCARAGHWRSRQ